MRRDAGNERRGCISLLRSGGCGGEGEEDRCGMSSVGGAEEVRRGEGGVVVSMSSDGRSDSLWECQPWRGSGACKEVSVWLGSHCLCRKRCSDEET